MNNLVEVPSALHKVGKGFKRINWDGFKYLILPLIYASIIIMSNPTYKIYYNKAEYIKMDSYRTITITKDINKLEYILDKYNLTKDEFNVLCAIVLSEAQSNSYEDAYAVINTIYNRTHSKNWVRSVNGHFGNNKGKSLYYQAISPNQFTVYKSGAYKRHLNEKNSVGYKAIIDFLYTEDILHNYLSFRSHSIKIKNSESFSNKGNNYFNLIQEKNRI